METGITIGFGHSPSSDADPALAGLDSEIWSLGRRSVIDRKSKERHSPSEQGPYASAAWEGDTFCKHGIGLKQYFDSLWAPQ